MTIDRFWKESIFSDDKNDTSVKVVRLREVLRGVGFGQISWNNLGGYILVIRIDDDNDDDDCRLFVCLIICFGCMVACLFWQALLSNCSNLFFFIECTSKILYNLYTTLLTPNEPFLKSQLK